MNFYLNKNGQKLGPYTSEQVQIFIRQGVVSLDDQVWSDGWSTWKPIRSVSGFGESNPSNISVPQVQTAPIQQQNTSTYVEGKEPVVACVLSLVIVGTGQFYNGEWAKGWVLLITCILAAWFSCGTFWLIWALVSAIDAYRVAARLKTANNWNWWA